MYPSPRRLAVLTASAALGLSANAATIIYQEDFDTGGTADLNGTSPDVGANNWVAADIFDSNGDVNITNLSGSSNNRGRGSATLAFTPVDGLIYTLDVEFGGITGTQWLAAGFARGQSSAESGTSRFIAAPVEGRAWALVRGSGNTPDKANRSLLTGAAGPTDWLTETTTFGGNLALRIVLDTTGGADNWTATYFVDTTPDTDGTDDFVLVTAETGLADEDINSVGIAAGDDSSAGKVNRFTLTSVPEPGSLALLGLGGLCMLKRRRRA